MLDLTTELSNKLTELSASIKLLKKHGIALAEAETKYKVALAQEVIRLKADGNSATYIQLVIYGMPDVAELRFKRDIAKVMYDTNQEHINVTKLQIRIIESQIQREWGDDGSRHP